MRLSIMDDDVDVESDFNLNLGLGLFGDLEGSHSPQSLDYGQFPWTLDEAWSLDHCTDDRSRAAIEKLLEEEHFHPRSSPPHTAVAPALPAKSPEKTTKVRRWSKQEKLKFEKAFKKSDDWKNVAAAVSTKTIAQVRLYGRNYVKKLKLKESRAIQQKSGQSHDHTSPESCDSSHIILKEKGHWQDVPLGSVKSEVVRITYEDGSGSDVDIDDDGDDASQSFVAAVTVKDFVEGLSNSITHTLGGPDSTLCGPDSTHGGPNGPVVTDGADTTTASMEPAVPKVEVEEPVLKDRCLHEFEDLEGFPVRGSNEEVFYLAAPALELHMEPTSMEVSDLERGVMYEFFDGRSNNKDPGKYLQVRRFILGCWLKCKPDYLKKTSLRRAGRPCGDVNVIGRVHAVLEMIGAINFNCDQVLYKQNKPKLLAQKGTRQRNLSKEERLQYRGSTTCRKRKIRSVHGDWINKSEAGTSVTEPGVKKPSLVRCKPKLAPSEARDPFQLVPCREYGEGERAPFEVVLSADCLVLMDIHCHCCKTEVIGLLGGSKQRGKVYIHLARACASLSTGIQCDMDPVSQTEASDYILSQGLQVVGWYHSHPTFPPNPSLRDLETQHNYQTYFAQENGVFVGIIVQPYTNLSNRIMSRLQCLITTEQNTGSVVPYRMPHVITRSLYNEASLPSSVAALVQQDDLCPVPVPMLNPFIAGSSLSCLDKVFLSIRQHLTIASEDDESLHLLQVIEGLHTFLQQQLTNRGLNAT